MQLVFPVQTIVYDVSDSLKRKKKQVYIRNTGLVRLLPVIILTNLATVFILKVSSLVAELGTLKKEKSELEQARSTAEEQMESMTKKHEEKVSYPLLSRFRFVGVCINPDQCVDSGHQHRSGCHILYASPRVSLTQSGSRTLTEKILRLKRTP